MNEDSELRDFAAALFGRMADEPDREPDSTPANHVPREGNNPNPGPGDDDMRTFVAALFNTTD